MFQNRRKIFIITLLLSLLFHLLIIWLFLLGFSFRKPVEINDKKLHVTFKKIPRKVPSPQPVKSQPLQQPQFFELVDNPNANQQKPEHASMLAEKSSVAAAPSKGETSTTAHSNEESTSGTKAEKKENISSRDEKGAKNIFKYVRPSPKGIFNKKKLGNEINKPQAREKIGTVNPSDEDTKVFDPKQIGKLALSTYAWEYAPYMKSWLRFLQSHWYAPPAYTELGLIQGQTIVRFRIYPDGHMEGLKVLYHEGHESLKQSSINAVKASFPFKPLPKDFPDPYLEVTLRMMYPSLRRYVR